MIDVTVAANERVAGGDSRFAAVKYVARLPTGSIDYRGLVDASCNATRQMSQSLFADGFRPWLILLGMTINADKKARFPNYTLAGAAKKKHLVDQPSFEKTFHLDDGQRTAGIYLVNFDKFCESCEFLMGNTWATVVLSSRSDFLSERNLENIYKAAGFDNGVPYPQINWIALAALVCPLGDIVINTEGGYDDRWREIRFISNAERPLSL